MVDIRQYMQSLVERLRAVFGKRLLYVGLQGSYARDEATENSDIDILVVLDALCISDMDAYRRGVEALPHADKSCGFICGHQQLLHWNKGEICQLLGETIDYEGQLRALTPAFTSQDVRAHAKVCAGNLYHEICHRYIHSGAERCKEKLAASYRQTFYILQSLHYLRTGQYIVNRAGLMDVLEGPDLEVLHTGMRLKAGEDVCFDAAFELLFDWCQAVLAAF